MSPTNTDSLYDDVRSNYNEVGAAIIQQLFGEGYLSPCGEEATDRLARLAGPTKSSHILDVGSGLGGPAVRLADRFGCCVTGLELVESNVHAASKMAEDRGLSQLIRFQLGDATAMPFANNSFSMVWGQDAWCHVPDRDAVIGECARVLEPGGLLAFSDWLLTGPVDDSYRNGVLPSMACPSLETLAGYNRLLEQHGFTDIRADDLSTDYARHYRQAMTRLGQARERITERYGAKIFAIVKEKNGFALEAFEKQQIGGGQFVARLPR